MRGYRKLKNSEQLDSVASVKRVLTVEILPVNEIFFSERIFGVHGLKYAEQITRQYLLARMGGLSLNKALLHSVGKEGGKVIYPLPKFWRRTIEAHNFRVSNFWCSLLWQLNIFIYFGFGLLRTLKISLSGICTLQSQNSPGKYSSYVYFEGLAEDNLPLANGKNKNIFSWYLQWAGRKKNIQILRHTIESRRSGLIIDRAEIQFQDSPVPNLAGVLARLKYFYWGLRSSLIAFMDMLRGRWWHAFLLNQVALMGKVLHVQPYLLAREYLFHNSNWIYRPLWTYEAESRGSTISFYFYSTNCENFMRFNGKTTIPYGWKAMSWPRYLVWDTRQAEFIEEAVGFHANINVVGEVWFSGKEGEIPIMPSPYIAVFDVEPMRKSYYVTLGLGIEFYVPSNAISFLDDILIVLASKNIYMAIKQKRKIGKKGHPAYRCYLHNIQDRLNIITIDSDIAAQSLIANKLCLGVISTPFTSTALLAKFSNKPSIFYDSNGFIHDEDPAAHGIRVIRGANELSEWVDNILTVTYSD